MAASSCATASLLRHAFEIVPDYLRDAVPDEGEVNFSDLGLQLSRTSHALKVWTSLRTFGLAAFRNAIDRSIDQALLAERLIAESDTLEILSPAQLGVVCFRRRFAEAADEYESDAMHEQLIAALEHSGIAFISSTRLRGRFAMRMCIMNFTTHDEDIAATIDFLASQPVASHPTPATVTLGQHAPLDRGWLARPVVTPLGLTDLPLFSGLEEDQARRVLSVASERTFQPGEQVIAQWDGSRELYVVLQGDAAVLAGGTTSTAHAGDTIGEIAALEWGAGYGYARTATVTASTDLRVLVFAAGDVGELVRRIPCLGERLAAIARSRLHDS